MVGLLPKGEPLRRAIRRISGRRQDPGADITKLVQEAGVQFDLSPLDQEFLWRTFVLRHARPEE
jgi:hypothetical protein